MPLLSSALLSASGSVPDCLHPHALCTVRAPPVASVFQPSLQKATQLEADHVLDIVCALLSRSCFIALADPTTRISKASQVELISGHRFLTALSGVARVSVI